MTPHIDLQPPTNAEIAVLQDALRRSGRPYTDEDLFTVMAWLAQTELAWAWLVEARAGRGALVVEGEHVRLVPNVIETEARNEESQPWAHIQAAVDLVAAQLEAARRQREEETTP